MGLEGLSPQAPLPTFPTLGDEIRSINRNKQAGYNPPRLIILAAGSNLIFDARKDSLLGDVNPVTEIKIQNLGNAIVKLAINQDAQADSFHWILKAGTADNDGTGGEITLNAGWPWYISALGTATKRLSVLISTPVGVEVGSK